MYRFFALKPAVLGIKSVQKSSSMHSMVLNISKVKKKDLWKQSLWTIFTTKELESQIVYTF